MRIMLRIDRNPIWKIVRAFLAGFVLGPFAFGLILGPGEYLPDLITELMGIGVTVLVIDWLYELRAKRELKHRLVREVGSGSNEFAKNAVSWLRAEGWLVGDGGLLQGQKLNGANLNGSALFEANLRESCLFAADLREAKLSKAQLQEADLRQADLRGAGLIQANLHKAILGWADLRQTLFEEADFQEASLGHAKLQCAILHGANLTKAVLFSAKMQGVELQGASLREARFERAELLGAILPDGTRFTDSMDFKEISRFVSPNHPEYNATMERVNKIRCAMGYDILRRLEE